MPHTVAEKILKRAEDAKADRHIWDEHYQEVADLVDPTRDFQVSRSPGSRRRNLIYDETAPNAHEELSATIDGMLTNAATRWFALVAADDELIEDHEVQRWLYEATTIMLMWLANPRSRFAMAIYEIYQDLVAFGTAIMLIRDDPDAIRFQAIPLANVYLESDERQEIVNVYRYVWMRAHEVVKNWGETVSAKTRDMADDLDRTNVKIELLHCVQERDERDPQRRDGLNKPWASFYIEVGEKNQLSERGFDENPYLTPRWSTAPGETYGRSPAIKALPAIKTANAKEKTNLLAGAKTVDPPLLVPAGSIKGSIRTGPGGINYYPTGTSEFPRPLDTGAKPLVGEQLLSTSQQKIETAFYLDKIRLPGISPQGGHPRMSIPEVIERRNQTLVFFAPILQRVYAELLSPGVTRLFKKMRRRGDIPPPPAAIAGRGMNVEYVSTLALAQRVSEVTGFIQLMNVTGPLREANPNVLDNLDGDKAFRRMAHLSQASPLIIRTPEEVDAIRQDQQQRETLAENAAIAETLAGASRDTAAAIKDVTANVA